ncbi:hypothetical protein VTO42DRAFT_1628 [Malbranchea cinnamomea]
MADMLSLHGWAYPVLRTTSASSEPAKKRVSRSSDSRSASPGKSVFRARSSNALSEMTSLARPFKSSPSVLEETSLLNTLKDPRTVSTSDLSRVSSRHPDLSNEVAALSDKLIQAINNQTILDDTLAATRQELDASRARISMLEQAARLHEEELSHGKLVRRGDVEVEKSLLREALEDERSKRIAAEKEKKNIEQELESLTAALFEEANKMVAAAKKEREEVERKNEQLRAQIKDTEMLLASHQEQLAELKSVMQSMKGDREELDTRTNHSSAPASPATTTNQQDSLNRLMEAMNLSPVIPGSGDISPAPSTSFPHLIKSVCRTDIQAYEDFRALLHQTKSSKPPSRAASGSYAGLNVMGLANLTGHNQPSQSQTNGRSTPSNSSSSPNGLSASPREPNSSISLKDTKFYKRVLTEDIEPTLRLDLAPSISWLTRRSVLNSICEGGLLIEPMTTSIIKYEFPCSLCGERRQNGENPRTHRFRTSDNDSAQRYPLCMVCLEKMRACCDFVSYLRLIVDGHVRVGDEEDEREVWEETIRLRERMFWSRMGGGVIPAFIQRREGEGSVAGRESLQLHDKGEVTEDGNQCRGSQQGNTNEDDEDPFVSKEERTSIDNNVVSLNGKVHPDNAAEENSREEGNGRMEETRVAEEPSSTNEGPRGVIPTRPPIQRTTTPKSDTLASSVSSIATAKNTSEVETTLKASIPASFEF